MNLIPDTEAHATVDRAHEAGLEAARARVRNLEVHIAYVEAALRGALRQLHSIAHAPGRQSECEPCQRELRTLVNP